MATEVGSGYISLVPSAKGFGPAVAQLIGGPVEQAAAQTGTKAGSSLQSSVLGSVAGTGTKLLGALGFAGVGLAAFKSAEDVENAQNIIIRSTGATGKAADSLEQSFKNIASSSPASFDTIAQALSTVYQRTGLTGKGLEGLTAQIVTFNRITKDSPLDVATLTQALAGFNVPAAEMGKTLDQLFTTSQHTGVPLADLVSTLVTAGPVARQFGFSISFTAGLLAQLNKAGIDANSIMPGLRKAFIQFARDGREPAGALREVLGQMDALLKKGDDAAARKLAVQLFGARGVGLVDAAISGKLSLQDLSETFDSTGKGILATASTTGTLAGKLGILKNQATLAFASFGTPLLKVAIGSLTDIIPIATVLGGALEKLAPALQPIIVGFLVFKGVGLVIVPLMNLISAGLLNVGLGLEAVGAESAASGLGNFAGGLQGIASKLPAAGAGAAFLGLGLSQAGKAGTSGAIGIGEMAAGGALLGSVIPGVGTAIGGLAGGVAGLAVHMLSGGQSVEEYRKKFVELGSTLDTVGAKQAAKKFIDQLGDSDKLGLFTGNVRSIRNELISLASASPAAAQRVVDGLKAMHDESGKPLFNAGQIQAFDAFVDQGIVKLKEATKHKNAADSTNQKLATSEQTLGGAITQTGNNAATAATQINDLESAVLGLSGGQVGVEQAQINIAKAQAAWNDALNQFGPDSAEARDAQLNFEQAQIQGVAAVQSLAASHDDLLAKLAAYPGGADAYIAAQRKLEDANPAFKDSIETNAVQPVLDLQAFLDSLHGPPPIPVTADTSQAETAIANLIGSIQAIPGATNVPGVGLIINLLTNLKGSAGGNFLNAGEPSVVGEQGWELFVPDAPGRVIPHDQSVAMSSAAQLRNAGTSGDQPLFGSLVVQAPTDDPVRLAYETARKIDTRRHLAGV